MLFAGNGNFRAIDMAVKDRQSSEADYFLKIKFYRMHKDNDAYLEAAGAVLRVVRDHGKRKTGDDRKYA